MNFTYSAKTLLGPALTDLGLQGNPFATSEAEQERDILSRFAVDIEHYDLIKENHTQIIFAPRGGGKSTLRVLRANAMAPINSLAKDFALEFTHFDNLYAKLGDAPPLQTADFVDEILRLAAKAIFSFLFENKRADKQIKGFSLPDQARLAHMLWIFSPTTLSAENLFERFTALLPETPLNWDCFCNAVQHSTLRTLLGETCLEGNPTAKALAFLVDNHPQDRQWLPTTLKEQLGFIVGMIHNLGYQQLVILIDRVDEIPGTVGQPEVQANLLRPLLAHLPLIETPDVCFKLFIPSDTRAFLMAHPEIRQDRLHDLEITVEWPDHLLRQLLERRLKALAGITDLAEICGGKPEAWPVSEKSLGEVIVDEMITLAQGSPRRLILAGQFMLEAYALRPKHEKILWEDWETTRGKLIEKTGVDGLDSLLRTQTSSSSTVLFISPRRPEIRIGDQVVRLTQVEYNILNSLISHNGSCHVETLHDEVWQNAVTQSGVDVAITRLRKKINDHVGPGIDGNSSVYLEKKSNFVMLNNYQVEEA